jgi:hypothetical protein
MVIARRNWFRLIRKAHAGRDDYGVTAFPSCRDHAHPYKPRAVRRHIEPARVVPQSRDRDFEFITEASGRDQAKTRLKPLQERIRQETERLESRSQGAGRAFRKSVTQLDDIPQQLEFAHFTNDVNRLFLDGRVPDTMGEGGQSFASGGGYAAGFLVARQGGIHLAHAGGVFFLRTLRVAARLGLFCA